MHLFLIIQLNDITQTGILIFLLYTSLSSVLNLNLIKSLPKTIFHFLDHQSKTIFLLLADQ